MCLPGYVAKTPFIEAVQWKSLIFVSKYPGVAGASGAVARSTVALWLRHVITQTTTRHPGHDG